METVFIAIHVLATGGLLAAVVVPIFVVYKKTLDQRDLHLLSQLKWLGTASAIILILSGLSLLDDGDHHATSGRIVFATKLGLILVSGILANLVIERHTKKALKSGQPASQKFLRRMFILHLVVVATIVVLGVVMSFGQEG